MSKRLLGIILILILTPFSLLAQSSSTSIVTTKKAGNWSDPTVWARGQVPSVNDEVVLRHNLIIDQPGVCKSMNLNYHDLHVNAGINFNVAGNSVPQPLTNNLAFYNGAATSSSQLIAIYRNAGLGMDFYLYGTWGGDTIRKITSLSMRRFASPDTTLNFLFNDSMDVTHYYMDVAGVKDTSLFRINYQVKDSLFVAYRLYTNWQNTVLLRSTHTAYIGADTSYVKARLNGINLPQSCGGNGDNLANIALGNAIYGLAGMAILGIGVTAGLPAVAAAAYIFAGMGMYYNSQGNTLDHIGSVIGYILCEMPSANADDKPPRNDDLTPNPFTPVTTIFPQSPLLFNCPCNYSWAVVKSTRDTGVSGATIDRYLYSATPACPTETRGDSPSGIMFQLGRGQSTTIVVTIRYFTTCPSNPNLYESVTYSKNFTCR